MMMKMVITVSPMKAIDGDGEVLVMKAVNVMAVVMA